MTQRAQIVFEKEETVLLRQSTAVADEFCPLCGTSTFHLTPEALTLASGVSERKIFRWIEAGEIHFYERPKVYVCLNSLTNYKRRS
ncbi:MAG: hypothetical protein ACKVRN_06470 [Pyrinomonadaceae bacterium]